MWGLFPIACFYFYFILSKTNEYGLITNNLATKCGQPRDMAFKVNVSLFRISRVYNGRRQVFNKRLEVYWVTNVIDTISYYVQI